MKRLALFGGLAALMLAPIVFCAKREADPEGVRPPRAGDIVVHKLGRRGVITMQTPHVYGVWNVRLESGDIEYWTTAEIDYRETP